MQDSLQISRSSPIWGGSTGTNVNECECRGYVTLTFIRLSPDSCTTSCLIISAMKVIISFHPEMVLKDFGSTHNPSAAVVVVVVVVVVDVVGWSPRVFRTAADTKFSWTNALHFRVVQIRSQTGHCMLGMCQVNKKRHELGTVTAAWLDHCSHQIRVPLQSHQLGGDREHTASFPNKIWGLWAHGAYSIGSSVITAEEQSSDFVSVDRNYKTAGCSKFPAELRPIWLAPQGRWHNIEKYAVTCSFWEGGSVVSPLRKPSASAASTIL